MPLRYIGKINLSSPRVKNIFKKNTQSEKNEETHIKKNLYAKFFFFILHVKNRCGIFSLKILVKNGGGVDVLKRCLM